MPQLKELLVSTINALLAHRPWNYDEFPDEGSVDDQIHWILNKENITMTAVVTPVVVGLYSRLTEAYPTREDVIRIVTSRVFGERPEDKVDPAQVISYISKLCNTRANVLKERDSRLQFTSDMVGKFDYSPDIILEITTKISQSVDKDAQSDKPIHERVRLVMKEFTAGKSESVRVGVAVWLFHYLSGNWPYREALMLAFPKGLTPRLIEKLLDSGVLRIRKVQQIAIGRQIDPTRTM